MIGTPLEYLRVEWRALGTVAIGENMRFMTGLSIRLLSGFYRAPDIMGWHAALLTMIGVIMAVRTRSFRSGWIWMLVAGWGFVNCLISGRRKALYMVAVFTVIFLWRYFRRLSTTQAVSFAVLGLVMMFVTTKVSQNEESSVYTKAASTTQEELWGRLEGGLSGTVEQAGIMGAGLGTATQGVYHVLREDTGTTLGWQEGGLGKLAIELGVPGLMAVAMLGLIMFLTMLKISAYPDVPGSSQLARAALFGIIVSNVVEFMVSAQAYSDPLLALLTAFLIGCMFATAALDERLVEAEAASKEPARRHKMPLTSPATA
jgi:Ca2+/Na+ antiporter